MVRDEEIQRLINYAKGLGLKVTFSSKKSDCDAMWYLDNSGIVIYKSGSKTKIETILSLIHELGHALHSIHERDRQIDKKFEKALDHIEKAEELEIEAKKRQRKVIFDDEVAGSKYWEVIYKDTNMKFPMWRLHAAMAYDLWQYEVFYETGKFPSYKERRKKLKEVTEEYRDNND